MAAPPQSPTRTTRPAVRALQAAAIALVLVFCSAYVAVTLMQLLARLAVNERTPAVAGRPMLVPSPLMLAVVPAWILLWATALRPAASRGVMVLCSAASSILAAILCDSRIVGHSTLTAATAAWCVLSGLSLTALSGGLAAFLGGGAARPTVDPFHIHLTKAAVLLLLSAVLFGAEWSLLRHQTLTIVDVLSALAHRDPETPITFGTLYDDSASPGATRPYVNGVAWAVPIPKAPNLWVGIVRPQSLTGSTHVAQLRIFALDPAEGWWITPRDVWPRIIVPLSAARLSTIEALPSHAALARAAQSLVDQYVTPARTGAATPVSNQVVLDPSCLD